MTLLLAVLTTAIAFSIISMQDKASTNPVPSLDSSEINLQVATAQNPEDDGRGHERFKRAPNPKLPCAPCNRDCKHVTDKQSLKFLSGFQKPWRQRDTKVCHSEEVIHVMNKARSIGVPGIPGKTVGDMVDALLGNGCPVIVKGGSVRDAVIHKQLTAGLDFVSMCSNVELKRICTTILGGNDDTCHDGYHDGNLPVFIFGNDGGKADHHFMVNTDFYNGDATELEFTPNSLAYDFQNENVIDVTGQNGYEDACTYRIGIPGPKSDEAWNKWSNPNKLFRFWKLRFKKCSASTWAVDYFVAKKASEYWKDQAYNPKLPKDFTTAKAPFFWLYCQKVLLGEYKNELAPCTKCAASYKDSAAAFDANLSADLGGLWATHLSLQAEAMVKSCAGNNF